MKRKLSAAENWFCEQAFIFSSLLPNKNRSFYGKARGRFNLTENFTGAAHNKLFLEAKQPNFFPVVIHNLSNDDFHLFFWKY